MSDRELLELAAKAAGYVLTDGSHGRREFRCRGGSEWNPLINSADALCLATRLNIDIMFFNGFQEVVCGGQGDNDDNITEQYGEDIQAAVRRCIVRAAAEIGRAMP